MAAVCKQKRLATKSDIDKTDDIHLARPDRGSWPRRDLTSLIQGHPSELVKSITIL